MKFTALSALALLISAVSAFHIVPPGSIVTCDPLTISYDTRTGVAPFSLSVHTDSETGPVIAGFTNVTGISYTWGQVTIAAGTNVVIVLSDSRGVGSATPVITVTAGSSDACLGSTSSTSIPLLPSVTSESPPTSSFGSSDLSSLSSSISSSLSSSLSSLPTITTTPGTSTDLLSSLSSLSSVISSASSLASNLTTSTPAPSATGGLSDSGAVTHNAVGAFTIGVITVFAGVLLA